jgi:hypothetical protein
MNTKTIAKIVSTLGASILVAGAAYAADDAADNASSKPAAANTQIAAARTNVKSVSDYRATSAEKSKFEAVDVSSPSYRKFIEDITERSGG